MKELDNVDAAALVDQILSAANLTVAIEERAALIQIYPKVRRLAQRLRLPEARYLEPAAIFRATLPSLKD